MRPSNDLRILRLRQGAQNSPPFDRRFFLTTTADLAQQGERCGGNVLFWHEQVPLTVTATSDLMALEPEVEAAILHLARSHGPEVREVKAPLMAASDKLLDEMKDVADIVRGILLRAAKASDFQPHELLLHRTLADMQQSLSLQTSESVRARLMSAWRGMVLQAEILTLRENEVFGLI